MNYDFAKSFLRRHFRHPRAYAYARRAMLVGQYVARIPDEPDFAAFRALKGRKSGLVVDVGANGGQSAVAFSFLLPNFQILSFEPNPALWRELDFVSRLIGRRFAYRRMGLGSRKGSMTLFVPQIGGLPITTRASLSGEEAERHCSRLEREVGQRPEIKRVVVDVDTFDSLALHPQVIKIDVEGFELQVLQGMIESLKRDRPLLMLESNSGDGACMELLAGLGYQILYYDLARRSVTHAPEKKSRNWFAVPTEQVAQFCG